MSLFRGREVHENKIQAIEKATEFNKTPFNIVLICNRYILSYFISGNREYLDKALNNAIAGLNHNPSNYDLFLLVSFIYVELKEYSKAKEFLQKLEPNRNYLKNYDMRKFLELIFIGTYQEVKEGNMRAINRFKKLFPNNPDSSFPRESFAFLGIIENLADNPEDAAIAFQKSYEEQDNKLYFFMGTYDYFSKSRKVFDKEIFYRSISWMIGQGIDIESILTNYKDYFELNLYENIDFYKRLYDKYNHDWILKLICRLFFAKQDKSLDALYYCKEADDKRLLSKEHQRFYIEIAYKNDVRTLNNLSVIDYLEDITEISTDMRAYLFLILLSDKKFKHIVEKYKKYIVQLAEYGIENGDKSEHFFALYSYFIANEDEFTVSENNVKKARDIIKSELFKYEITIENPDVRYVWIKRELYRDVDLYPIIQGSIKIDSPTEVFDVVCLNEDKNLVMLSEIIIRKSIPNISISSLISFYNAGFRSTNLTCAISNYLVDSKNSSVDVIRILEKALEHGEITDEFRTKINITIGNILNANGAYEDSLKYYYLVKDHHLEDKFVEPMLLAFVNSKEVDKAVDLILSNHSKISDKTLFHSIKEISKVSEKVNQLSNIGYNLLIKGWYDRVLINLVVKNYNGELKRWMMLYKVLANVPNYGNMIDEIILEKSMFLKTINTDIQKVFVRSHERTENIKLKKDFIYFLSYKILEENFEPELDVLKIMENEYLDTKDKIMCYALSVNYINQDIVTDISRDIINSAIKYMEKDDILLPPFKKIKDKVVITPYIEKNQPFIYKTLPNRKVYLNYKFNESTEFKKKLMNYVRFGTYITNIVTFYSDKMTYFISEEIDTSGTIQTKKKVFFNDKVSINHEVQDRYFVINNALVCEKLLKYDEVYDIITSELTEKVKIKGKLI